MSETLAFVGLPPCFALSTVQGGGYSDLLGRYSMSSLDCVNPDGGFDPGGRNAFAFSSMPSQLVFTAANGDRVFATYSGIVGRDGRVRGHFVITGGTGQFFAATGGGTLAGREDTSQVVTAQGYFEAEGEITY